jgi:hypothetical protein
VLKWVNWEDGETIKLFEEVIGIYRSFNSETSFHERLTLGVYIRKLPRVEPHSSHPSDPRRPISTPKRIQQRHDWIQQQNQKLGCTGRPD